MRFSDIKLYEAQEPLDPKLKKIEKDIKSKEAPPSVIHKMAVFLRNLLQDNPPEEPKEIVPDEVEPVTEAWDVEVDEAWHDNKWTITSEELQVYEMLKKVNPEQADETWTYYNRAMIEQHLVPMFLEKDITKPEDQSKIVTMFIKAPGKLEDKVTLAAQLESGGTINIKKLLTSGSGSINQLINYKSNVLDHIKHQLITLRITPATTSAATGDGEAFFLVLGKGITKLGAGDLNVSPKVNVLGHDIEVKAQRARLSGYRGTTVFGDATSYYPIFNKELAKILGPAGVKELENAAGFKLNQPYHFTMARLRALSAVLAMYGKGKSAEVKSMFDRMLQFVYKKSTPSMRKRVAATIKNNGSFDIETFRQAWFLFTFDYYSLTNKLSDKEFDGVLFINQHDFTYAFIKNADESKAIWDKFTLDPMLFSWTNERTTAPEITLGKPKVGNKVISTKPKSEPVSYPDLMPKAKPVAKPRAKR